MTGTSTQFFSVQAQSQNRKKQDIFEDHDIIKRQKKVPKNNHAASASDAKFKMFKVAVFMKLKGFQGNEKFKVSYEEKIHIKTI